MQFSADDQLICLHDLTDRPHLDGHGPGVRADRRASCKRLDFGSRDVGGPDAPTSALITLRELLIMVRDARGDGRRRRRWRSRPSTPTRAASTSRSGWPTMLAEFGWDQPGSPVRGDLLLARGRDRAARRAAARRRADVPDRGRLRPLADGQAARRRHAWSGPTSTCSSEDPEFVARAAARGHEVHVWTVNEPEDIAASAATWGSTGFTTDYPDRVAAALDHVRPRRAATRWP